MEKRRVFLLVLFAINSLCYSEILSYCPDPSYLQKNIKNLENKGCLKDKHGRIWENGGEKTINLKNNETPVFDSALVSNFLYGTDGIRISCNYDYANDNITLASYFKLEEMPFGEKWSAAFEDGNKNCPKGLLDEDSAQVKDCPFEVSPDAIKPGSGYYDDPEAIKECQK